MSNSLAYIVTFKATSTSAEQQAALAAANATLDSAVPQLRMAFVSIPSATAFDDVSSLQSSAAVASVEADKTRVVEAAPSDTSYPDQWSLPKIGWDQLFGTASPSGSATVAILDTGVDGSQPDLAGSLVAGTSVFDGSNGQTDLNGHGTWMAGIVAAQTDNGAGIAGIGYAGVRVMPVTVLGADGTGQDSDIITGVVYAADHGADVILMAFSNPAFSPALQAAIDYAWSRGSVLVAATGNNGSDVATFPAGDRGVIGVANTDQTDALNTSSNYGPAAFMAAPGTDIDTTSSEGGVAAITGTSASAAEVAGAAALLHALDPAASNGTIVGRLARNADPTTSNGSGNGRLNLARAAGDTSTSAIEPAGTAPVGNGGPIVGPYVVDASFNAILQGISPKGGSTWVASSLMGYQELDLIPTRVLLQNGPATGKVITVQFDHTKTQGGNTYLGIENLTSFTASSNVTITSAPVLSAPVGQDVWSYTFTVDVSNGVDGWVQFNSRLAAGAHLFTGSSLSMGGSPSLGTLQIAKPAPKAGNPDLTLSKSGPSTAAPGSTITYTLSYTNKTGGTITSATGVQLRDVMPSQVTYVANSCTATCSVVGNTITWDLGTLAPGATGSKTYQVTVSGSLAFGSTFTNAATIRSAETDANLTDNDSSVTTTVNFNRAPVAVNDSATTNEDTSLAVNVIANDSDPDGTTPTVKAGSISSPAHGTATLITSGTDTGKILYTPAANYNGPDSFTYQATDGSLDSNTATVSITVTPVNDAPAAANNTVTTNEDTAYTFAASDFGFTDPNDSPANSLAAVEITTLPAAGTLKLNGSLATPSQFASALDLGTGKLVFYPAADANGSPYTSFTFQVQDNGGTANGGVNLDQSPNTLTI
ncbi:MAG: S8 family serine peptidase, partial [Chloroflexota bacterium]|nr:S8 family serine peptidase [Chloroflexota bacterium]